MSVKIKSVIFVTRVGVPPPYKIGGVDADSKQGKYALNQRAKLQREKPEHDYHPNGSIDQIEHGQEQ